MFTQMQIAGFLMMQLTSNLVRLTIMGIVEKVFFYDILKFMYKHCQNWSAGRGCINLDV